MNSLSCFIAQGKQPLGISLGMMMSVYPDETVVVEVAFTTKVFFHKKVMMPRSVYDQLNRQIEGDEDVDLTEWVDWSDPTDISESCVRCFEIQQQ